MARECLLNKNGSTIEATWIEDKIFGHGTSKMYLKKQKDVLKTDLDNSSDGDISCASSNVSQLPYNFYVGDWFNNRPHGRGEFTTAQGAVYAGDFFESKQHGFGVETWPDGTRYEGQYKDGKKHGQGKFIYPAGSCYTGTMVNDAITGYGIYESTDRKTYKGMWVNGEFGTHGKVIQSDLEALQKKDHDINEGAVPNVETNQKHQQTHNIRGMTSVSGSGI
mmetsp:Transcript_7620/g.8607  ORF Transcript_7620/g.8607 Transcript_7620/m.8607 type:complete len:221 (-) Transcript_7620:27-689(-)